MTRINSTSTRNRQTLQEIFQTQSNQQLLPYSHVCADPQGPRGLKRVSSAVRLLGFRVWISPRHECLSLESVICSQVEVFASGWWPVQTSPTECSACECDREVSHSYHVASYEHSCDIFHTTLTFSLKIFRMTYFYVSYYFQHRKHTYMQIIARATKL